MKIKTVDLYEYFGFERKEGSKGYLKCIIQYEPKTYNQDYAYPAMLIMPGGAYAYVSPREADPIAIRYAAYGFQTFILDYTVGSVQKYPAQLTEAAMAMIYIRENAAEFDIAPNMAAAVGFSAGGHLCACLATLFDEPFLKEKFGDRACLIRPDAVVLSYPVITSGPKGHKGSFDNLCGDNEELKQYLSLEKRVTSDSSPAFLWHTYEDTAVPPYNSLVYAMACEEHNVPYAVHVFEKGRHGLATGQLDTNNDWALSISATGVDQWLKLSVDWLKDRNIKLTHKSN
ncbi:MAG TPA: alpha/beta hydrolase [Clostridia bacterium]